MENNQEKIWDKAFVYEQMGDDGEIYKIVAANMIETFTQTKADLEGALKEKNYQSLSLFAHSVKSMLRTFGADSFAKVAEKLEKVSLIEPQNHSELEALTKELITKGNILVEVLKADIAQN